MLSKKHESGINEVSRERIDSIERLIRWIAPRTVGRDRVLQRVVDLKKARLEIHRLHATVCLLSRELDALYPQGAIISLARRRVRNLALMLARS